MSAFKGPTYKLLVEGESIGEIMTLVPLTDRQMDVVSEDYRIKRNKMDDLNIAKCGVQMVRVLNGR